MTQLVPYHDRAAWLDVAPPADADRLAQLTAAWLARRAEHTQREYRRDLGHWLAWCARCGVSPLEARMMHMDGWIAWQRRYGVEPDRSRPAAESSIARRVAAISSWYAYLIRNTKDDPRPLVTSNPADTDGRPRADRDASATVHLTTAEAHRLIEAADADGFRSAALIRLLLYTGLRCGDATAARVDGLGYDAGHRTLDVLMKNRKRRRIPLPPALSDAIERMLQHRPAESPYLFVTKTGRPMAESHVFRLVRRLAGRAGIASVGQLSPHSLRHTFATDALDAGIPLAVVQDAMGHADPRTTQRYNRNRGSLDRHPAYILASRFGNRDGS